MGKGEKLDNAVTRGLGGGGCELPNGRPTPTTLEDVEGYFSSLFGVVVIEIAILDKLVNIITTLIVSNATLTAYNIMLVASNAKLTKALSKSKGAGGSGAGGGCGGRGNWGWGEALPEL